MTVAYFESEGYYAKNDPRHRRASFWHGEGAAALGLPQHVSPSTFERVLAGYVPGTEIRLGRARDGEHQHRPGLDLTLSAPKSVSLEALLYGNRRVLGAHDAAVRSTLDWVEAELLQTRGYDPATGRRPRVAADGLVAAGFRHPLSVARGDQSSSPRAGPLRPSTAVPRTSRRRTASGPSSSTGSPQCPSSIASVRA